MATKILELTVGLPASGKTTAAKTKVREENKRGHVIKRINRDDLRAMVNCDLPFNHKREDFINRLRVVMIEEALKSGFSVINDDTNLGNLDWARQLARDNGAEFRIMDFRDVPLEECIRRDKKRPNYVGEDVIKRFYNKYLRPEIAPLVQDESLPSAYIFDLDGTCFHLNGRDPFDASTCENDLPNPAVIKLAKTLQAAGNVLIFCSGRKDTHRKQTISALAAQGFSRYCLYMRRAEDNRKDSIVKSEILDNHILPFYNVQAVVDDRNQVVEMWRNRGLTCLQVAEGDF